ncbi:predicted protein [Uncinocarpus reesii 1704]|uniref:Uncharacterized protein n=1 Tax=Uncinocarpus reesii (strain UAMH 1704) TaxID=336963 RepID=C4JQ76_UNCRE|nr:uncharacterized protein UREG_03309 [Uncinocarpus reesii 1704]EEP78463.1 predicted protein [Uncinocarpus reesii 1704]
MVPNGFPRTTLQRRRALWSASGSMFAAYLSALRRDSLAKFAVRVITRPSIASFPKGAVASNPTE